MGEEIIEKEEKKSKFVGVDSGKKPKVAESAAIKEVQRWIDYKKLKQAQVEAYETSLETLKEALMSGAAVLSEDCSKLTYKLTLPIGSEAKIDSLEFKTRIETGSIDKKMKGVKSDDAFGMVKAVIAALTTKTVQEIKLLDSEDNRFAQAYAVFFV